MATVIRIHDGSTLAHPDSAVIVGYLSGEWLEGEHAGHHFYVDTAHWPCGVWHVGVFCTCGVMFITEKGGGCNKGKVFWLGNLSYFRNLVDGMLDDGWLEGKVLYKLLQYIQRSVEEHWSDSESD